jgi:hypothetical protein
VSTPTKREERAIDKAIEETKDTAKKALQEVKRELPEYTAAFHDYQEQNINAVKDMTNTFLESQKEVVKSLQAAYRPYAGSPAGMMFWPWNNPQGFTEAYVRAVSNFADSSVAAARLSNDMMLAAMESARSSIEMARNNTRSLSGFYIESAHAIERASRESTSQRGE